MNDLYGSSTRLRQDASLPRTASGIFDKRDLRFAPRSTGLPAIASLSSLRRGGRGGSAFAKGFGPIKWREATAA